MVPLEDVEKGVKKGNRAQYVMATTKARERVEVFLAGHRVLQANIRKAATVADSNK